MPPSPEPNDEIEFTELFHRADLYANNAQKRYLQFVRWHILVLLGASFAQVFASLHSEIAYWFCLSPPQFMSAWDWERIWYVVLAVFVGGILITRFVLGKSPHKPWIKARALAEQAKQFSWYYAMGLTSEGQPIANDETASEWFNNALQPLQIAWKEIQLNDCFDNEKLISPFMEALRTAILATRLKTYEEKRYQEQLKWYQDRANRNKARTHLFKFIQNVAELFAFLGAVFLALRLGGFSKWTGLMYPGLSIAAATLAWTGHKRYQDNADAYTHTVDELKSLDPEFKALKAAALLEQNRFAELVKRSEEILGHEHVLWYTKRGS